MRRATCYIRCGMITKTRSAKVSLVFMGLACAFVACKPTAQEHAPAAPAIPVAVTVAPVVTGPIAATFEVTGTVQALEQAEIGPSVAGRVAKVYFKDGEAVKAGRLLFRLDRLQAPAKGSRTGSRAAARRPTKKDAEVRSPLAGVVLARHSNPGDTVSAAPPTVMAVVADIDLMKMTAPLPEARRAEMSDGQEVTVTSDALPGRGFGGRVSIAAPVTDVVVTPAQIEILVNNPDHDLKPGMFARARVFTAFKSKTILVPLPALDNGRVTVVEGGVARVRTVLTGIRTEETVEVLSGVAPGDLVVVSGNSGLSDGARVTCQEP